MNMRNGVAVHHAINDGDEFPYDDDDDDVPPPPPSTSTTSTTAGSTNGATTTPPLSAKRVSFHNDDEENSENALSPIGYVRKDGSNRPTVKKLRSNLMRQQKDRDPLFYYEVSNVLGLGSMGSVAKVRKRDEVLGGSARKALLESFSKERKAKTCLQIPVIGGLFRYCIDSDTVLKKASSSVYEQRSSSFLSYDSYDDDYDEGCLNESNLTLRTNGSYEAYYAMKSIHLDRVTDPTFIDELKNEIEILKKLDHPHIVRPIETFEHRNQLFIVMELCSGGDLYTRDPYTEEEAARIVSSILSAVAYMHRKQIVHRDLKYENILFVNESPRAEIKLIDFGLSSKYGSADSELTEGVGTIYTMAPEVMTGTYSSQADLWSVGVIAYMLLSSQMPFYGRKKRHIVEQIMNCKYDFNGRRWRRVSEQAKAFVEDLLVADPRQRATANEAMCSLWLNKGRGATVRGPTEEEIDTTTDTMKKFVTYSKLKKLALMVVAHKSTSEEIGILRKVFQKYDSRGDGNIRFSQFRKALSSYGFSNKEMKEMFEGIDLDGTGKIRYTEFLAATIEAQGAIDEVRLAEAFDRLDSDDSGYISANNLREILGDEFPQDELEKIIREADLTHDNQISYPEFLALWENQQETHREELYESIEIPNGGVNGGYRVSSPRPNHAERQALRADSEAEGNTIARANFIGGKKSSERKMEKLAKIDKASARKLVFAESVDIIPGMVYSNDGESLQQQSPQKMHLVTSPRISNRSRTPTPKVLAHKMSPIS